MYEYVSIDFSDDENNAQNTINLRKATSIRELDADNSFEVIVSGIVHTLVAEDEDDLYRWLDSLYDVMEMREQLLANDDSGIALDDAHSNVVTALQSTILFSGEIGMTRLNRLTQTTTWRDRYASIAAGTIFYYESYNDFSDTNKTYTGTIPLSTIVSIFSSTESKAKLDCGFDIVVRSDEPGVSVNGLRTYSFATKTPELCIQWMEEICKASGSFVLIPKKDGSDGFESIKKETDSHDRPNHIIKNVMITSSGGGRPGRGSALASGGRGFGRQTNAGRG